MTRIALLGLDAPALRDARRSLVAVGASEAALSDADMVLIDLDSPAGQLSWLRWPSSDPRPVLGMTSAIRATTPYRLPPGPPPEALAGILEGLGKDTTRVIVSAAPPPVAPVAPAVPESPRAADRAEAADDIRVALLRWPGLAAGRLDAFRVATTLARGADSAEGLARRSGVARPVVDALLAEGVADGWVGQALPEPGTRHG
ncbi:MAG: hypothetical protein ACK5XH_09695 [Lysobacteraceae bacterium]